MHHDFGVGVRREHKVLRDEVGLEFLIVLNNAVVDERDGPVAAVVRVSIRGRRPAVGRPARVSNRRAVLFPFIREERFQNRQFTRRLDNG